MTGRSTSSGSDRSAASTASARSRRSLNVRSELTALRRSRLKKRQAAIDLTGLRVKFGIKVCCNHHAVLARGRRGFHVYCSECNKRLGEFVGDVARFVQDTVRLFGTPSEPIFIRAASMKGVKIMGLTATELFPGKYYKAADLKKPLKRTIASVNLEEVQDPKTGEGEDKAVMRFEVDPKGLVLNKTNFTAAADAFGEDSDDWVGKSVELFVTSTSFGPGVRLRAVD